MSEFQPLDLRNPSTNSSSLERSKSCTSNVGRKTYRKNRSSPSNSRERSKPKKSKSRSSSSNSRGHSKCKKSKSRSSSSNSRGRSKAKKSKRSTSNCKSTSKNKRSRKSKSSSSSSDSQNRNKRTRKSKKRSQNRKSSRKRSSSHQPKPPPQYDVEILPTPIKSPADDNLYRVIKLPNGLHAILIADKELDVDYDNDDDDDDEEDEEDFNCVDNRIGKFNKEVLGLSKDGCCICVAKAPAPTKDKKKKIKFKRKKPKENERKKNFCKSGATIATVALSVGSGSYDEPDDILGLAHLTEHAVFLGSIKYPDSAELDSFIGHNGGTLNGTTEGNNTTFIFQIDCSKLEEALKMFADNLSAPLLIAKDIVAERDKAVDSEFQDKKGSDSLCRIELLQLLAKKGNPVTRFGFGSKETLQTADRRDTSLAERLATFYKEHYTVDNMTIAIQSPTDLDTLQELIIDVFGDMKSSGKKRIPLIERIPPELLNPYDTPEFKRWYNIIPPESDTTELTLTWAFPPENYRTKLLDLIGYAIRNESEKGLAYFLRQNHWIKSIEAGPGSSFCESNEILALFAVKFNLTKKGILNIDSILEALFSYIKYLINLGPQKWIFTEKQQIAALEFHFTDKLAYDTYEFCKTLAKDLKTYGSRDIICGDILIFDWEPQGMINYLTMLQPSEANFMLSSKLFQDCDRIEPYFGTKYGVKNVNEALMDKMTRAFDNWNPRKNYIYQFQPLVQNPFITTNFCPVRNPISPADEFELENEEEQVGPHCMVDTERCELWHRLDLELAIDSIYMFELVSTIPSQSAHSMAMLDVWIFILKWTLRPLTQLATTAQLKFNIFRSPRGVFIEVEGLTQHLKLLLDNILIHVYKMNDETRPETFEMGKHGQLKEYTNTLVNTEEFSRCLKAALTTEVYWIENDLYDALNAIDYKSFQKFCKEFISQLFVLGLAQGNVADSGVQELRNEITRILQFEPYIWKVIPDMRGMVLPLGTSCCRVLNTKPEDNNAIIMQIFQIGPPKLEDHARCLFLADVMFDPAFQQLRVLDGLGYDVTIECNVVNHMLDVTLTVQSHSDKFKASRVRDRINAFIVNFYDQLKDMSQEDYQDIVDSAVEADDTADTNWNEIKKGTCKFNRFQLMYELLKDSHIKDVVEFYERYFLPDKPKSEVRKLCIEVVGGMDAEWTAQYIECKRHGMTENHSFLKGDPKSDCHCGLPTGQESSYPLTFLASNKKDKDKVITNIQEFKENLFVCGKAA